MFYPWRVLMSAVVPLVAIWAVLAFGAFLTLVPSSYGNRLSTILASEEGLNRLEKATGKRPQPARVTGPTQRKPCSMKVGTSGMMGSRSRRHTARMRSLPAFTWGKTSEGVLPAKSVCPPRTAVLQVSMARMTSRWSGVRSWRSR